MRGRLSLIAALMAAAGPGQADAPQFVRYLADASGVRVETDGGRTDAETPFAIASVGKAMTSVALLRLVARGELALDDPAADHLPAEAVRGLGGLGGVTVRHLLAMTSGLPDYLDDAYLDDALDDPGAVQRPLVALSYAYGEDRLFAPGRDFDYSNTNYVLAGLILERVTGLSYARAMEREVLGPAGMGRSFVFGAAPLPPDFPNGHEDGDHVRSYYRHSGFGDGGVIASAADVARFYRALFVERSLLPPALLAEMTRDPLGVGYGLGVELDGPVVGHSGGDLGFASDVRLDRRDGAVAVILVADAEADTDWTDAALADR